MATVIAGKRDWLSICGDAPFSDRVRGFISPAWRSASNNWVNHGAFAGTAVVSFPARLDRSGPGNTVLRMTTLTFKIEDDEARSLRAAARRANLTLSEFVRRRLRVNAAQTKPVGQSKCRHTGAMIFAPAPQHPPLTTAAVKEMLADFP